MALGFQISVMTVSSSLLSHNSPMLQKLHIGYVDNLNLLEIFDVTRDTRSFSIRVSDLICTSFYCVIVTMLLISSLVTFQPPFQNATVRHIRAKYPQPWDESTEKLVAFL